MALGMTSPRVPVSVSFRELFDAWRQARKGKIPSAGQLAFDAHWLDRLMGLQSQLSAGDWQPTRTVSFIVDRPKTREIHAPAFSDRVVHHWLIAQLEPLFEPVFIHDSFANRKNKGTHAAVNRLQEFMRQRNGIGHYLQLDVHNCFNSVHRGTLYRQLCVRLGKLYRTGELTEDRALALRSLCHKLLVKPTSEFLVNPARSNSVPAHKLLRNAALGCGIPVGNLTSQFFVNVYLNALDQFVKHELKVRHYVRYVDDFVLLGDSPEQLQRWCEQIEAFLSSKLHLRLKQAGLQQALCQGVDFLGYRIFTRHKGVRPRVVARCREVLEAWASRHVKRLVVRGEDWVHICTEAHHREQLQAQLQSYWGHFSHAQSVRVRRRLWERYPWLNLMFKWSNDGDASPNWTVGGVYWQHQLDWLGFTFPGVTVWVEKGCHWLGYTNGDLPRVFNGNLTEMLNRQRSEGQGYVVAVQAGRLKHGLRRREVREWFAALPNSEARRPWRDARIRKVSCQQQPTPDLGKNIVLNQTVSVPRPNSRASQFDQALRLQVFR